MANLVEYARLGALQNPECSFGLNPPDFSSDLATVCSPRGYLDQLFGAVCWRATAGKLVNITIGSVIEVRLI